MSAGKPAQASEEPIQLICPHEFALTTIAQGLMDLHLEGWDQASREAIFEAQQLVQSARSDALTLATGRQHASGAFNALFYRNRDCDPEHLARKFTELAKEFARLGTVFLGSIRKVQDQSTYELVGKRPELTGSEDTDVRARLLEMLTKVQEVVADLIVEVGGVGDE